MSTTTRFLAIVIAISQCGCGEELDRNGAVSSVSKLSVDAFARSTEIQFGYLVDVTGCVRFKDGMWLLHTVDETCSYSERYEQVPVAMTADLEKAFARKRLIECSFSPIIVRGSVGVAGAYPGYSIVDVRQIKSLDGHICYRS